MSETDPIDRIILAVDRGLRGVAGVRAPAQRPYPGESVEEAELSESERRHAAALLRVDHAGEVAAQALYEAQALTARSRGVREHLRTAAREESDHLAWCARRLDELGGRPSLFDGFWYAGSFAIGALAGLAGDRASLGFVAETERQVEKHLDGHLGSLPREDRRSRALLVQMRLDEARHGSHARAAGAAAVPAPIRALMGAVSRVMTFTAYRW